jgi:methylmalonyl-CoA/ethylmalonyl-CoA epimerase
MGKSQARTFAILASVFALGVLAGRGAVPSPRAVGQEAARDDPYAKMLHVGILVRDLDAAVARYKALGFSDIQVLPPNKGVDRTYHGKPIDVTLKQAFIRGTSPLIELMEPVGDAPSPWGDYLKEHGEAIHHIAYRVPDTAAELEKYRRLGLVEIAQGKWPEGDDHWGTFHYVQDPKGGAIVEFISRVPRARAAGP